MGDLMLLGVLRMPLPEKYDDDPLAMMQFVNRAREAADRIEADAKSIAALRKELDAEKTARMEAQDDAGHERGKVTALRAQRDRLREAAAKTLTWLTNPNTHDDLEVVAGMFGALWDSGYEREDLDRLAATLIEQGLMRRAALRDTGSEDAECES